MNKPSHIRQYHDSQPSLANKVNRNLNPALIKIQELETERIAASAKTSRLKQTGIKNNSQYQPEPGLTESTSAPSLPANQKPNTLTTALPTSNQPPPSSSSARIVPWLIASITLTLALFSGNYAWNVQQQVEKLNLRLEQIEEKSSTAPITNHQETSEKLATVEKEVLALTLIQQQLRSSNETQQAVFNIDTEQTNQRLTDIETAFANFTRETSKPLASQSVKHEPRIEPAIDKPVIAKENWFINIASFSDRNAANNIYQKALKITEKASIKPIVINGRTLYRIRANGYNSQTGAEDEAQRLQKRLNLSGLWVSQN